MNEASTTHLVLVPSYNTGARLLATVQQALAIWRPVWVVIDGSTDGTGEQIEQFAEHEPGLRVIRLARNGGKGSAVLQGLQAADAAGFTHVLTMDADGQHDAGQIAELMALSQAAPQAAILGVPVFDASAPLVRVLWRRVSNVLADMATLGGGIGDTLFGFRVYPVAPLLRVFEATRFMRRFDFDAEAAIRLCWMGVRPVNVPSRVRYFSRAEGGVSHFHYMRDNALLAFMYARLFGMLLLRLPGMIGR